MAGAGVAGAGVSAVSAFLLTDEESAPPAGAPNVKVAGMLAPNREEPPVVAGASELALLMLLNKGLGVSEADDAWAAAEIVPNRAFGVDSLS